MNRLENNDMTKAETGIPYSGKVWRAECSVNLAFGGEKFGELIDWPKDYQW